MQFLSASYQKNLPASALAAFGRSTESPPRTGGPRHFEDLHYSPMWRLDMKGETALGVAPAEWSLSSQMNDPRPNGRCIFDARFIESPVGRSRAHGDGKVWDPRGVVFGGDALAFAEEMRDETAAAKASADDNRIVDSRKLPR